jgi:glucan phosphoethanolaminetransferase (alkaline phosphatase superfamily)
MNALPIILSIASALLSLVFAMFTLVFLLAAGANSTPAQVRELKFMCWTLVIATAIAVAVTILLLIMKRPWWSVAAASVPAALSIVLLIILFVRGDRSSELPPDGFMNARQKAIARAKQAPVQHPEPIAQSTAEENAMPSDKLREFNDRKEAERQEFLKHVETLELAGELKAMEDAIMKRDNSL